MKSVALTIAIPLAALAVATGCQDREAADVCRVDCRLTVTLPDNVAEPPDVSSEQLHLAADGQLDVLLEGGSAGNQATQLQFFRPGEHEDSGTPFVNRNGQPMYRVNLNAGNNNGLQLRPWSDGVCHAPKGCKYDIVNNGNPDRPKRDPWIILYQ